jgi:hypothetical protein
MPRMRELAHRKSDGIEVWCDWNEDENECVITVISPDAHFMLHPPNHKVIDCYRHPFFYMDRVLTTGQYR